MTELDPCPLLAGYSAPRVTLVDVKAARCVACPRAAVAGRKRCQACLQAQLDRALAASKGAR